MTSVAPILAVLLVSFTISALTFNAALNRINPLSSQTRLRDNIVRLAALSVLTTTYLFSVGYLTMISHSGIGLVPALALMAVMPLVLGVLWRRAIIRVQAAE